MVYLPLLWLLPRLLILLIVCFRGGFHTSAVLPATHKRTATTCSERPHNSQHFAACELHWKLAGGTPPWKTPTALGSGP